MTPQQDAINFLIGLKMDIEESEDGTIDADADDIGQIENCLEVIGKDTRSKDIEFLKEAQTRLVNSDVEYVTKMIGDWIDELEESRPNKAAGGAEDMGKYFEEMKIEGVRQDEKGFDANHDDSHTLEHLCDHILAYTTWAKEMLRMSSPEKFRRRIMQAGTIAVKTLQSYDRRIKENPNQLQKVD